MQISIIEVARRIKDLREIAGCGTAETAAAIGLSQADYEAAEAGDMDFSFTFIHKCAAFFGVDMVELLTGENPHLRFYSVVRAGEGLPMQRRTGFSYQHLGFQLRGKLCEPFLVTAPFLAQEQNQPIPLSAHEGQEFDYVLSGQLKLALENHIELLNPGDSVLYDASHSHGMVAAGGQACVFLAVTISGKPGV